MSIAGELNGADASEACARETVQGLREVEVTLTEWEVLMPPARTIREVDMNEARREALGDVAHRLISRDHAMAHVERQTQVVERSPAPRHQRLEPDGSLHEHPRLRLQGDAHSGPLCVREHRHQALDEAIAQHMVRINVEGAQDGCGR